MTIRKLLMESLMSLVLGGCSSSFMSSSGTSAPGNGYGYNWDGGKPIYSVGNGGSDGVGKPLHHGTTTQDPHRDQPSAQPPAPPQRTKPTQPPQRTKPTQPPQRKPVTPHRTKPGTVPIDPGALHKPTRTPIDPGALHKPTRQPLDPGSSTPKPHKKPQPTVQLIPHIQPLPTPKPKDGVAAVLHRPTAHRTIVR